MNILTTGSGIKLDDSRQRPLNLVLKISVTLFNFLMTFFRQSTIQRPALEALNRLRK